MERRAGRAPVTWAERDMLLERVTEPVTVIGAATVLGLAKGGLPVGVDPERWDSATFRVLRRALTKDIFVRVDVSRFGKHNSLRVLLDAGFLEVKPDSTRRGNLLGVPEDRRARAQALVDGWMVRCAMERAAFLEGG